MRNYRNKSSREFDKEKEQAYVFASFAGLAFIVFSILGAFYAPVVFAILTCISALLFIISCVVGIVSSKLATVQKRIEGMEKRLNELEAKIEDNKKAKE